MVSLCAVSVRTPRHLYSLSQFPEYYHSQAHNLTFRQELDLDYGTYTLRKAKQPCVGAVASLRNGENQAGDGVAAAVVASLKGLALPPDGLLPGNTSTTPTLRRR